MSGFVVGIALLFELAAAAVWGMAGYQYAATKSWHPMTINELYGHMFNRSLGSTMHWFGSIDLGIACVLTGLVVYQVARRLKNEV